MPKASRDLATFEKRLRALSNIKVASQPIQTTQLNKAAIAAQRLQQQQQRLAVSAQELANRQERARQAADRLARSQQRLAEQSSRASRGLGANADAHIRAFRAMETGAKKAKAEVDKINAQTARQAREQQRIQEQAAKSLGRAQAVAAKQNANELIDSLNKSGKAGINLERILNRVGGALTRIGSGLSQFGRTLTVALTAPLAALAAISIRSASSIDEQVNTLKAFTGSAEAAEERLRQLIATAQATPGLTTSLGAILDGQFRLANATVETIDKVLPAIGRINAVGKLQDPQRFAQNLTQLVTQDFERPDLKELVGQSPIAGQLIKEIFNVDSPINSEAIKSSAKKLGLTTVDAFLTAFAQAAGQNQALAAVTESISTKISKSIDRVSIALRPLGLALLDVILPAIDRAVPLIERFGKAFAELSTPVKTGLIVIGGIVALLGPALVVIGGLVTALGGVVTALGAVATVVGTIGFAPLLAVLAGIVVILTEWAAIAFVVFKAWEKNFLGIREIVAAAAGAVLQAFARIKAVLDEAARRILPTLQSVTGKILRVVTEAWEKYGKDIVRIVGGAFAFVTRIFEGAIRQLGNFVDLLLKLIDGDFRGAWAAFARIVLAAFDTLETVLAKLLPALARAFAKLNAFILAQAVRFAIAAQVLALKFVLSMASKLRESAFLIRDALIDMLLLAVQGLNPTTIAAILVARFIAALRRAAAEGVGAAASEGPNVGGDIGNFPFRKKGPPKPPPGEPDKKAANALRQAQKEFEQQQNEFARVQAENRLALTRSGIQQQFELTKDGLDRESDALKNSFDDRLVNVRNYFSQRKKLQEAEIDSELRREKDLSGALQDEFKIRRDSIEAEFQATIKEINRDPSIKGRVKDLQIQTAEKKKETELSKALNDFETQNAEVSTRILTLQRKRLDVASQLTREEKELLKQIQKQEAELSSELLEEQGLTTDAAALRLGQRFKDTIQELRVDVSSLSPELQRALNDVDFATLKARLNELPQPVRDLIDLLDISFKKAVIQKQSVDIERTLNELGIQETAIQNQVLDGVLSEKEARAAILGLQDVTRQRLLDILAAQLAIAESTQGQEDEVLRIRARIQEIERLGVVIDDVGQQINQELFSNIEQGLEGFFQNARRGFDGLKDAAISFGESVLSTLNKIAAQSITDKLAGIFKPDAGNTEGTVGGFFSKLFGLKPKVADTAAATALTTAGTTAGTALTTGATAASTALATGGATASASLVGGITAAAASFAAAVTAAGAAFAATVAAASSAQAVGGLGGALGAAKGDFLTPKPGGRLLIAAEAGYPEAVLTTDPKHAARQYGILKAFLRQTRGLQGRIPRFAEGGFVSPRQTEMDLLSSIERGPSPLSVMPVAALANAGGGSTEVRLRQILVTEDMVGEYLNSPEGERVFVDKLSRNAPLLRRLTQRR
jgi:hypothetical protein